MPNCNNEDLPHFDDKNLLLNHKGANPYFRLVCLLLFISLYFNIFKRIVYVVMFYTKMCVKYFIKMPFRVNVRGRASLAGKKYPFLAPDFSESGLISHGQKSIWACQVAIMRDIHIPTVMKSLFLNNKGANPYLRLVCLLCFSFLFIRIIVLEDSVCCNYYYYYT